MLKATAAQNQTKVGGGAEWSAGPPSLGLPWLRRASGSRRAGIRAARLALPQAWPPAAPALRLTAVGWPGSAAPCAESAAGSG